MYEAVGVLELLARIGSAAAARHAPRKNGGRRRRRSRSSARSKCLTPSRTVLRDGAPSLLTPKEYDLLAGADPSRRRVHHATELLTRSGLRRE